MKYAFTLLMMSLLAMPAMALEDVNSPEDIVGTWWTPKKDARIEIYENAGTFDGKIVWMEKDQEKLDSNNPDPAKRSQKIMGLILLKGFKFNRESSKWIGGTIYDPKNGKTYACKMWLDGGGLKVRGYIGVSLFGRTEMFTSYKPQP